MGVAYLSPYVGCLALGGSHDCGSGEVLMGIDFPMVGVDYGLRNLEGIVSFERPKRKEVARATREGFVEDFIILQEC